MSDQTDRRNRAGQATTSESTAALLQTNPLNSVLQAALGSLNVQLDEELTRYRRLKTGRSVPPRSTLNQPRKPLDLISVGAVGGQAKAHPAATEIATPQIPPQPTASRVAQKTPTPSAAAPTRVASAPVQPTSTPVKKTTSFTQAARKQKPIAPTPAPTELTGPTLASTSSTQAARKQKPIAPTPAPTELTEPTLASTTSTSSSAALAVTTSPPSTGLVTDSPVLETPLVIGAKTTHPDRTETDPYDYLESSEELLRSLSEEEGQVVADSGLLTHLFTPVGIAALTLFLLSSATLGYVLTNSSILRLSWGRSNPTVSNKVESPTPVTAPSSDSSTIGLPKSPDLAAKEFVDLNLNTLGTLKTSPGSISPKPESVGSLPKTQLPKPQTTVVPPAPSPAASLPKAPVSSAVALPYTPAPVPAPIPAPVVPQVPYTPSQQVEVPAAPVRAYRPPVVRQPEPDPLPPVPVTRPTVAPARPAPVAVKSAPPPPPAPVAAPAEPAPVKKDYYYVTSDYNSDRTLEQAQEVVPEAYVRNFSQGAQIQMGAFSDEAKAQELVQQLQEKGIPAQVRPR